MGDDEKKFCIFSPLKNDAWSNFLVNLGFKSSPYDPRYSTTVLKFEPRHSEHISGFFERWMVVNENTMQEEMSVDTYCAALKVKKIDSIDITLDVLTFLQNSDMARHLHVSTQVCINTILEQCGQNHNILPQGSLPIEDTCQNELLQSCVVKSARPLQLANSTSVSMQSEFVSDDLKNLCIFYVLPVSELQSKQVNTAEMTAVYKVDGLESKNVELRQKCTLMESELAGLRDEVTRLRNHEFHHEKETEKMGELFEAVRKELENQEKEHKKDIEALQKQLKEAQRSEGDAVASINPAEVAAVTAELEQQRQRTEAVRKELENQEKEHKKDIEALQKQLKEAQRSEGDAVASINPAEVAAVTAELEQQRQRTEAVRKELENQEKEHKKDIEALQKQLKEAQRSEGDAVASINPAEVAAVTAELKQQRQRTEAVRKELGQKEEENQKKIDAIQKELQEAKKSKSDEVAKIREELETTRQELTTEQKKAQNLETEKKRIEDEKEAIESAHRNEMNAREKESITFESIINAAASHLDSIDSLIQTQHTGSMQNQNELSSRYQELEKLAQTMQTSLEKTISELEDKLKNASKHMDFHENMNLDQILHSMLKNFENVTNMKNETEKLMQTKTTELEEEIKTLQINLKQQTNNTATVTEDELESLRSQPASGSGEDALQVQLQNLTTRKDELQRELTKSHEKNAKLEREKQNIVSDKNDFAASNASLRYKQSELEQKIAKIEAEKKESADNVSLKESKISDLQRKLQENDTIIKGFEHIVPEIKEMNAMCRKIHTEIQENMFNTPAQPTRRNNVAVQINEAQLGLEDTQAIIATSHNAVLGVHNELKILQQDFQTLTEALTKEMDDNKDLKTQLEEKTTALQEIELQLESTTILMTTLTSENDDLQKLVESLQENERNATSEIESLEKECTEMQNMVQNVRSKSQLDKAEIQNLSKQLDTSVVSMLSLVKDLKQEEEEIKLVTDNLREKVDTLLNEKKAAEEKLQSLQSELENAKTEKAEQVKETKQVKEELEKAKTNIQYLKNFSESVNLKKTQLQEDFDREKAKADSLEHQLQGFRTEAEKRQKLLNTHDEAEKQRVRNEAMQKEHEDIRTQLALEQRRQKQAKIAFKSLEFDAELQKNMTLQLVKLLHLPEEDAAASNRVLQGIANAISEYLSSEDGEQVTKLKKLLDGIDEKVTGCVQKIDKLKRNMHLLVFGIIACEVCMLKQGNLLISNIPFELLGSLKSYDSEYEYLDSGKAYLVYTIYCFLQLAIHENPAVIGSDKTTWLKTLDDLPINKFEVARLMLLFLDGISKTKAEMIQLLNHVDSENGWSALAQLVQSPDLRAQKLVDLQFPSTGHEPQAFTVAPSCSWFQPAPAYETAQQASCTAFPGFTQQLPPATYHYAYGQMY